MKRCVTSSKELFYQVHLSIVPKLEGQVIWVSFLDKLILQWYTHR